MAQSQFSSPEHLKYRVPARLCRGAHDHAMDGIRYFVMGLREQGKGYVDRKAQQVLAPLTRFKDCVCRSLALCLNSGALPKK